jgi:hypothetical protein
MEDGFWCNEMASRGQKWVIIVDNGRWVKPSCEVEVMELKERDPLVPFCSFTQALHCCCVVISQKFSYSNSIQEVRKVLTSSVKLYVCNADVCGKIVL